MNGVMAMLSVLRCGDVTGVSPWRQGGGVSMMNLRGPMGTEERDKRFPSARVMAASVCLCFDYMVVSCCHVSDTDCY